MTILELVNNFIDGFYDLANQSLIFRVFLIIWSVFMVVNKDRREGLIDNLVFFLGQPLVTDNAGGNKAPSKPERAFYPRAWFVGIHKMIETNFFDPLDNLVKAMSELSKSILKNTGWPEILQGFLLGVFIYAEIIGGINIADLSNLISWNVPVWLGEYSITLLSGTILSILVAGIVAGDILGDEKSKNQMLWTGPERRLGRFVIYFLIVSSFLTIIGINLVKVEVFLPDLVTDYWANVFTIVSAFFLHIVVILNAGLALFLLHKRGVEGLKIWAVILVFPVLAFSSFSFYLLKLAETTILILVDFSVRIIFCIANLVFYILTAPLVNAVDLVFQRT
jgi:hypothetical protein